MYSIIGSGFGLYGYLPAIINLRKKGIILPEKYKEKILSRSELKVFNKDIIWVKNRHEALKRTTTLIVSVPPNVQYGIVKKIIKETNINTIFLEKPVAPTPEMSSDLLKFLDLNNVSYVIGYSFFYLNFQTKFYMLTNEKKDIYWNWTFMAHHFLMNLENWKRYHDVGGGVLRFYGIHIIVFLYIMGYRDIINSTLIAEQINEPYIWKASISGKNVPVCHITINSKCSQNIFTVSNKQLGNVILQKDPFDCLPQKLNGLDRRVTVLMKTLDIDPRKNNLKSIYSNINMFWNKIEKSTKIINNID